MEERVSQEWTSNEFSSSQAQLNLVSKKIHDKFSIVKKE